VKLFRHPTGSAVMADLYSELQTAERNAVVAEFYSREFALLGGAQSSAGKLDSLVSVWDSLDGLKRRAIMKRMILCLTPIIEKGYVDPAPVHRCGGFPGVQSEHSVCTRQRSGFCPCSVGRLHVTASCSLRLFFQANERCGGHLEFQNMTHYFRHIVPKTL
jgi:hypothetical protein